jgi:TIGR03009 family protein
MFPHIGSRRLAMPFFYIIPFLIVFCAATGVFGQAYPSQPQPNPTPQPLTTSLPIQQPIRQMPLQTPPKTVIHNGVPVYQPNPAIPNQPAMANRTMPTGYGSPYPTGQLLPNNNNPVKVATTQTAGSVYGLPPQNQPPTNPPTLNQPNPNQPATTTEHQRQFVGHAEPPNRIVPFFLAPQEQQELDEFLIRWEKYSLGIKRYDVDFTMFLYDETMMGSIPGKPYKTTFGYFKYIAKPLRFVYHVEGEWVGDKKVERDEKKNPNIFAEKIIIDEKSVFKYEFNAKKVLQVNVPPELVGKGIADSPLPLIFGAKADEMKKRFSMKIVTSEQYKSSQIWLQAKPLQIEDQQEFSQIEIRLDKESLRAIALKKEDINGKAFTVYTLLTPIINGRLTSFLEDIRKWFTPAVPDGWTHEVNDWVLEIQMAQQPTTTALPGTIPATTQPPFANQPQQPRNEIPLYQPKY